MLDMVMPTIEYPEGALNTALAELKSYCGDILGEIYTSGRLPVEAKIYGQLVQLFDKYNLKTQGVNIILKTGYYNTSILIVNHLGQELGVMHFDQGRIT